MDFYLCKNNLSFPFNSHSIIPNFLAFCLAVEYSNYNYFLLLEAINIILILP